LKPKPILLQILKNQIKNIKGSKCKLLKDKKNKNHCGLMIMRGATLSSREESGFFFLKKN
jgi:hypothetical protein